MSTPELERQLVEAAAERDEAGASHRTSPDAR
jgi:hypothetical protein